jgi:DNA-binding response OmpR family regulator
MENVCSPKAKRVDLRTRTRTGQKRERDQTLNVYGQQEDLKRSLGSFVLDDTLAILVVEDDQSIQSLVEEALTDGGFEPHIAASAEEAVTLLQDANSRYRALVTDISLAGAMDGWQVAKHAREIDQAFPVIYMVGAHADQWAINGVPNSLLLVKPFAPAQLVSAVSQLLNAATSQPIPD